MPTSLKSAVKKKFDSTFTTAIGETLDDAIFAIEHDNQRLKGVSFKDYARASLDRQCSGDLIKADLVDVWSS